MGLGAWLSQLVECATLHLGVMSLSPMFSVGITLKKREKGMGHILKVESHKTCSRFEWGVVR